MADPTVFNDDLLHQILLNKSNLFQVSTPGSSRPSSGYSSISASSFSQDFSNLKSFFGSVTIQTPTSHFSSNANIQSAIDSNIYISPPSVQEENNIRKSCTDKLSSATRRQIVDTPTSRLSPAVVATKTCDEELSITKSIFRQTLPVSLSKSVSFDIDNRLPCSAQLLRRLRIFKSPSFHSTSAEFYTLVHLNKQECQFLESTEFNLDKDTFLKSLKSRESKEINEKLVIRKSKSASCLRHPPRPLSDLFPILKTK